ncbi:MAG TPA: hypothetical protein VMZ92_18860 [Planctomycetota bacterium]|nr:hypothetical protein [Planctomycetota bacterium]
MMSVGVEKGGLYGEEEEEGSQEEEKGSQEEEGYEEEKSSQEEDGQEEKEGRQEEKGYQEENQEESCQEEKEEIADRPGRGDPPPVRTLSQQPFSQVAHNPAHSLNSFWL